MERLTAERHTRLRYFCSPQHTDSALYPIITQMERAAGFGHNDTAQTKLDKLDALLAQNFTPPQDAALIAEMLSLPNDGRYPKLELVPQQRRQTLEALTTQLELLARSNPVLMIFEDVHWLDPTTLELLGRTVDRLKTLRVLLIITYRPEFEPPWIGRPYVSALSLNRLGEREIAAMIDRVTGNKPLSETIRLDIIERTDGIPLFVEEMTKAVLEAESEGDARKTTAAVPSSAIAVPASLHASLIARLDRLGPVAKEVAQVGAAIGREFSYEVLAPIVQKSEQEVQTALSHLTGAGLVFWRGTPPQASFLFKHVLVRDVAYGGLLRAQRQHLHARIAEAYESRLPETARTQPELIAYHFTQAGMSERAIDYWRRAGDSAMARSANVEAIHHFSAALDLVPTLDETPEREAKELELCVKLGPGLMIVKGTASSEVHAIYTRAAGLRTGEDSPDRFKALWGLFYYSMTSGRLREAATYARDLLALAQRLGADDLVLEAYHARWPTSHWCGELSAADLDCSEGISRYDRTRHHALTFAFSGHDPGVCAQGIRAINTLLLGFPLQAIKLGAEVRDIRAKPSSSL